MDPSPSPNLDIEDLIVAAVRRLMRAVDMHSRRLVDECGLTGPQLTTLREVARGGEMPATALARAVRLSGATMTGILTRLERRGLVTRTRGESDRRTVQVAITELGRGVLAHAPSLLRDRFRQELSSLATWEQLMMLANLQRIASMMDAEQLDAAPYLVSGAGTFEHPVQPPDAPDATPPTPPISPRLN